MRELVRSGVIPRTERVRVVATASKVRRHAVFAQRFKEDVREVREGFECGRRRELNDLKVGDLIEAYRTKRSRRSNARVIVGVRTWSCT